MKIYDISEVDAAKPGQYAECQPQRPWHGI